MWVMHAGTDTVRAPSRDTMLRAIQAATSHGQGEIWLEHPDGPALGIVLGQTRAMVLRLEEAGDAGYHAVDLTAAPIPSDTYTLSNGQVDEYDDRDTVNAHHVLSIVDHFLATGERWTGVVWHNDGEDP
ncbi:hypothetical protein GCM10023193_50940 [Planotetraspora kaengkrachanensis]|uniref:Immunity protein Imm1 n=2 Tax=Planotetraspora kaengkrachanensis TaxID=575193 RepID=A0A8J3LUX9_9ACTN|nr:hypothetical protein Pka01_27100 [Planotetraspora kaengkrachanensis]